MKTIKLLFAALLLAITVYSCSSDRDEESVKQSSASKVDLKKLKTNINQRETGKVGDSIIDPPKSLPANAGNIGEGINPNEPNPVVDPTKPDKPW